MPDPIPFRRRREDSPKTEGPAIVLERALARQADPSLDVHLFNAARVRRYQIRQGRGPFEWFCQVWFDGIQHRGGTAKDVTQAQRMRAQYERELAELRLDGWSERPGRTE